MPSVDKDDDPPPDYNRATIPPRYKERTMVITRVLYVCERFMMAVGSDTALYVAESDGTSRVRSERLFVPTGAKILLVGDTIIYDYEGYRKALLINGHYFDDVDDPADRLWLGSYCVEEGNSDIREFMSYNPADFLVEPRCKTLEDLYRCWTLATVQLLDLYHHPCLTDMHVSTARMISEKCRVDDMFKIISGAATHRNNRDTAIDDALRSLSDALNIMGHSDATQITSELQVAVQNAINHCDRASDFHKLTFESDLRRWLQMTANLENALIRRGRMDYIQILIEDYLRTIRATIKSQIESVSVNDKIIDIIACSEQCYRILRNDELSYAALIELKILVARMTAGTTS